MPLLGCFFSRYLGTRPLLSPTSSWGLLFRPWRCWREWHLQGWVPWKLDRWRLASEALFWGYPSLSPTPETICSGLGHWRSKGSRRIGWLWPDRTHSKSSSPQSTDKFHHPLIRSDLKVRRWQFYMWENGSLRSRLQLKGACSFELWKGIPLFSILNFE